MTKSDSRSAPQVITTCADAVLAVKEARAAGRSIGVVPTMGALHQGHLSLVRASRATCDVTVATIFVNPTQFGPREDLTKYPRTLDADLQLLAECGTDLVFIPTNEEMYPIGFSTYVEPPQVAQLFDGQIRPGHFRGVCTVVLKLFQLVSADRAFFGQKDFQQSLVIRRMVADLNLPIHIDVCPIVREPDGLAMSSRNRYLNPAERQQSLAISRSLRLAMDLTRQGERRAAVVGERVRQLLLDAGITQIDYVAFAHSDTLQEVAEIAPGTVALIAVRVGSTRLIDNEILA